MLSNRYRIDYLQKTQKFLNKYVEVRQVDLTQLPGFVYFATDIDFKIVKIGYSKRPEERIPDVNIGCTRKGRVRLFLWSYYQGTQRYNLRTGTPNLSLYLIEEGCHLLFSSCYLGTPKILPGKGSRFPGELFRLEGELKEFVETMPKWDRERSQYRR